MFSSNFELNLFSFHLTSLGNETSNHFVDNSTYVRLQHNGIHETYFPLIVLTSCHLDIASFPFDEQTCSIKFSTWTNDQTRILFTKPTEFSTASYTESKAWTLLYGKIFLTSIKYECCEHPFSGVNLEIKLRRNSLFYGIILLFPITMAWIPILMGFVAPASSGERISFSISVLLTLVFYIEVANKNLPRSSNHIPLFGQYYAGVVVIIITSTLVTAILTKYFYRREYKLREDFNSFQKALLCFGSRIPFVGTKCRRFLELKCKMTETLEKQTRTLSSTLIAETAFQNKESSDAGKNQHQHDRLSRLVKKVQQVSLDEGFVEEQVEKSKSIKNALRKRTGSEQGTTSDSQSQNTHITTYRQKFQSLQSIAQCLGKMIEAIGKQKSRDIEQTKHEQYANALVDMIDRIALLLFTLVLLTWFMATIGLSLIQLGNEQEHEH
jgi:Neurotransmitter-gated ion-channel transmembrane region./Neurotransmitter-gated ion-channel ligand binding domain.